MANPMLGDWGSFSYWSQTRFAKSDLCKAILKVCLYSLWLLQLPAWLFVVFFLLVTSSCDCRYQLQRSAWPSSFQLFMKTCICHTWTACSLRAAHQQDVGQETRPSSIFNLGSKKESKFWTCSCIAFESRIAESYCSKMLDQVSRVSRALCKSLLLLRKEGKWEHCLRRILRKTSRLFLREMLVVVYLL